MTVRFNGNQWEWSAHLTFNLQSGALQNFKYVQAQFEYSKSYRKRSKIEENKSDRLISGFVLYSSSCILLQRHSNKTEARSSKAFCVFLRRILSTESINSEINQSNENSSSYREIIRIYEIKNTHRFSIFLACRTRKSSENLERENTSFRWRRMYGATSSKFVIAWASNCLWKYFLTTRTARSLNAENLIVECAWNFRGDFSESRRRRRLIFIRVPWIWFAPGGSLWAYLAFIYPCFSWGPLGISVVFWGHIWNCRTCS